MDDKQVTFGADQHATYQTWKQHCKQVVLTYVFEVTSCMRAGVKS